MVVQLLLICLITAPEGGGNEIQVFVDNVRQQEGSSNVYTLGFDGSSEFKRITFTIRFS